MGANFQLQRNCQDSNMKMKICRIKSGLQTSPSFRFNMYRIEDWFKLDLTRNLLCHCSKWSTVQFRCQLVFGDGFHCSLPEAWTVIGDGFLSSGVIRPFCTTLTWSGSSIATAPVTSVSPFSPTPVAT